MSGFCPALCTPLTHDTESVQLNAGVRYVQGMNEVLAPLWWALANDPEGAADRSGAEADTFFCCAWLRTFCRISTIIRHFPPPSLQLCSL